MTCGNCGLPIIPTTNAYLHDPNRWPADCDQPTPEASLNLPACCGIDGCQGCDQDCTDERGHLDTATFGSRVETCMLCGRRSPNLPREEAA